MKSEVHSAICGLKTPCEHLDHSHSGESGISPYTASQASISLPWFIIILEGGDLLRAPRMLLSSFSYHQFLHTHDVYTIHPAREYGAKPSFLNYGVYSSPLLAK